VNDDSNALHDGSYLVQRAKLFAYVNNNIDIKRILQDKQFHLQLKSEQKERIQNVMERKDSMAVLWYYTRLQRDFPLDPMISSFPIHLEHLSRDFEKTTITAMYHGR
jgi:hypothetical protein